ncbi:transcription factor of the MADS box [Rhizopus stolonifer]|uniref:Transcription factor of the MADS box n=1 Tax=Rhizopus stolonifer TaxID=4846 RepID=A0A367JD24_RHIST|nr:transcription factor of the MADS box [Rhizopus stolonifer]
MNPNQLTQEDPLIKNVKMDDEDNDSGDDSDAKPSRRSGRRKIKIEYIEDKNRRHITFSKRKAGIMKKAYELSTLTGTQVLLLVVSETGLVYTFTTVKLQPIVTKPEGKNLIQACLNAPDPMSSTEQAENEPPYNPGNSTASSSRAEADKKPIQQQSQQPHYMPHPQQHGYWSSSSTSPALRQQEDEKARRGLPNKN